jgi:hypothetical protein
MTFSNQVQDENFQLLSKFQEQAINIVNDDHGADHGILLFQWTGGNQRHLPLDEFDEVIFDYLDHVSNQYQNIMYLFI